MWRSSLLAAALLALLPGGAAARLCWPPVVEGGQRLQPVHPIPVTWLPVLFRQHEVCWRTPAGEDEKRVFLTGSSGVFGFPHPAELSVAGLLNTRRSFEGRVHFFNLGHLFSYQIKDALVLREALEFEPSLIVHAVDLSDFVHQAPLLYTPVHLFLMANRSEIAAFADEAPPGIAEPLAMIRDAYDKWEAPHTPLDDWRQVGLFVRLTAEANAHWLRDLPGMRPQSVAPFRPQPNEIPEDLANYSCRKTLQDYEQQWKRWSEWNILEYLADVRKRTGIPVVIVHWPVAERPRGRCFSARFPKAELAEFRGWLEQQTRELGLPYLDYFSLLPTRDFIDSIHATPEGQRKIATQLARDLEPWLE